jgi:hypothetical protein
VDFESFNVAKTSVRNRLTTMLQLLVVDKIKRWISSRLEAGNSGFGMQDFLQSYMASEQQIRQDFNPFVAPTVSRDTAVSSWLCPQASSPAVVKLCPR